MSPDLTIEIPKIPGTEWGGCSDGVACLGDDCLSYNTYGLKMWSSQRY